MAWTPRVNDSVIDSGLTAAKNGATGIYICSTGMTAQSTYPTYTEVTSTYALGNKVLAAGAVFPTPIAASGTDGRKIDTVAVADGSVTGTGTAAHWGITTSPSTVWAAGNLASTQAVTTGNQFTLGSFSITIKFQ